MEITNDIKYVGVNDHEIDLFEGQYDVPNGMAYNSYVIVDEKVAVMDTVDARFQHEWLDQIGALLGDRQPDYLIIQHMEPDHSANIANFMDIYKETKIVSSVKAFAMMKQFFGTDFADRQIVIKEGDTLELGKHTLAFVAAPMVHWPEVMVTYDAAEKVLFSADAFGTFGAFSGNLFADQVNFERDWLDDARRYYANIVGKYGTQVQTLLKKTAGLDIAYLCPLHGPIWRENIGWFVDKYQTWSSYAPEEQAVAIFCGSVYGHTENAAEIVANRLAEKGIKEISLHDVSGTDVSVLVSEAFRCSHLVLASSTYNGGIFTPMENFLTDLKAHNFQNRTVAVIDNGSWAATAGKQMRELVGTMKNMTVLENSVSLRSSVKEAQRTELEALADALAAELLG